MALKEAGYREPAKEELERKALKFIRECKPREYKKMKELGEVEEYCRGKAEAAINYAESLIGGGMYPGQAWNMAIRSQILESESD